MRRFLDGLYVSAGVAGALAIFLIFALVGFQISARLLDWLMRTLGLDVIGLIVPSIAEICGFLLAAGSFLALPYTLVRGGHIRIGIVVNRLPAAVQRAAEVLAGAGAALLCAYATVALARLALRSLSFGDVSYGIVPIPLALPQAMMALGLAVMTVALIDVTWQAAARGERLPGGQEV
jgi:TRAP-type C4-dicarboxylate transport system permease small subunit